MAGREAKRNKERLEYKFFVQYFKNQHKDLYNEASDFYKQVKEKNPNVRDLTKTVEFVATTTPNAPIPPYYYRRQSRTTSVQQMVLNIPLIKQTSQSSTTKLPSPATVQSTAPSTMVPSPATVPSTVSSTTTTTTTLPSPPTAPLPVPSPPTVSSTLQAEPLMLPDDIFQGLLSEIQHDPDLWAIFNNFDTVNIDDDDEMNPQVWNDLSTQDISPLEMEIN